MPAPPYLDSLKSKTPPKRHARKSRGLKVISERPMPRRNPPLAETRRDLLAHELQRAHDFFVAEQTSAIELRQDAIEAELAGQILEAHRHRCWSSDNHFIAQRIFIADGLQRLASLGAFRAHTGPLRRALELESERPVELHD